MTRCARSRSLAAGALAVSSLASRQGRAAEAASGPADEGNDVTVVEVRGQREKDPAEDGVSASVLSRRSLESLPGGDTQPLAYAITTQPGFVADTFGFGPHARAADGGIVYVIDGIPLVAAPLGQFESTIGFLPTRIVQRMTVMTGGFPAEFAAGAGAVVDIRTRHGLGAPAGEAQVSYGTYGTTDLALNYSQQIGRFDVFATASLETTQRGIDPPSVSPILHDQMRTGSAFLRVDYLASDHDRLELLASYGELRAEVPLDPTLLPLSRAPLGAVRGPDDYGNSPPPFVPYDANPIERERNLFAALSYTHASGDAVLQLAPFVRESYGDLTCDPQR